MTFVILIVPLTRSQSGSSSANCVYILFLASRSTARGRYSAGNPKLPEQSRKSFVAGLAAQYGHRLRRFLFTRARNSADIPDLAQEVFLRLMRVAEHEIIRSPEAYLFTVARHVAHQHTLHEANSPKAVEITELFPELQMSPSDDPLEQAEVASRIKNLKRALEQLPPRLATTLLLHRFDGFSIEEIAQQLGVARITAAKYLAQALLHCRRATNDRE
jgi:RNA polymerase sigma factor (sigma-70 family)